ncbi:GNAT family N-acetyltransferase [Rhodoferax sp. TH121]|uniref:GNAT family N-acetyltransferase n=1 Tax=Rhodoferax sp. TH121 TaxID=2022803 RepID=UPI000B97B020|nr:N-acetyltransferase [Rhodoferax sp. TH121]OYQ43118.1 GNAT family N-acetyltransferase [Rhodoferax sp. TH121]
MAMQIRPETPADIDAITALTAAAFLHAAHTSHTEQFIINALRAAGQLSLSLVAVDGALLLGHVALSPVTVSDGSTGWYGLGPISVLPSSQGQGVGSQLMRRALTDLQDLGAAGCVLLGDPGYYARFGFAPHPGLVLDGVPPEYFMAMGFGGALPVGTVQYHAAFDAVA